MSALSEGEVFLSFDELFQLSSSDICVCVDKYSALNICQKSSAAPSKIYNVWVHKLLKAYNPAEFSRKDWELVIEYLGNVMQEFVKNLNASNDKSKDELNQWWLDSLELLKWLQTIISTLEVSVISLIMTFALEIIIRTCKFANKQNFKILCNIQQLVISLNNDFLYKMPIKDDNEMESFNKILSSLCDVGSIISSADIKTSIETWRTVAKLGEKLHNSFENVTVLQTENSLNIERHWNEKAILGIFKEINKILRLYNKNSCSSNDTLLQVAQFYLKLLRLIVNYTEKTIKSFPAINLFMDIYTFCQHEMVNKENPKIELFINKPLLDIFALIYRESVMGEVVLQHIKYDADNFTSCKFVFDYLKVCIEKCATNSLNVRPDVEVLLKIYNLLVEGPLIFIDKDKYSQALESFVVLTIFDSTNKMHKKLCEYVMDSSWIRAYTSMDILTIYYSYILNQQQSDTNLKCLEFWFISWNKFNKSNETYRQYKKLIEVILKVILNNISSDKLQQFISKKFENIEVILLICGKHTEDSLQYLHKKLVQNLNQMQDRSITEAVYQELLNLLEICILRPELIKSFLKENLLDTLTGLLILSAASELQRFHDFIKKCLRFFSLQQDQQQSEKLLKYLMDNEQQCCNIQSVFLVEFLLKQRPHSAKLLQTLNTTNELTSTIINLIDYRPSTNQPIDLNIFKNLPQKCLQTSNRISNTEQITKKPRLDESTFSNIKLILNDLNRNTQKLLSFPRSSFDANDLELMLTIKNSIEKCLAN